MNSGCFTALFVVTLGQDLGQSELFDASPVYQWIYDFRKIAPELEPALPEDSLIEMAQKIIVTEPEMDFVSFDSHLKKQVPANFSGQFVFCAWDLERVESSKVDEYMEGCLGVFKESHASYIYPGEGLPSDACSPGVHSLFVLLASPTFTTLGCSAAGVSAGYRMLCYLAESSQAQIDDEIYKTYCRHFNDNKMRGCKKAPRTQGCCYEGDNCDSSTSAVNTEDNIPDSANSSSTVKVDSAQIDQKSDICVKRLLNSLWLIMSFYFLS